MNVRELVTKFGFKADTAAVEKFSAAVDRSKVAASKAAKAAKEMASAAQETAKTAGAAAASIDVSNDAAAASFSKLAAAAKSAMASVKASVAGLKASLNESTSAAPVASKKGGKHGDDGMFGGLGHHLALLSAGYVGFHAAESGVEHFSEFQQNMQKAGAAMMASAEQVAEMSKRALEVSGDLGFNARQASEGLIELGSAGFEAEHAMKMLPTSLKLARAGMIDPKLATELLASTLRGFYGNDSSKAEHVGDVLARVHDVGGVKMPALLESMKYVAPAAKAMGQSLEDVGTMTALLGRFGISGSMAGNALKSMLVKLAAPSSMGQQKLHDAGMGGEVSGAKGKHAKKVHESMVKAFGLDVADAKGNMLPMVDIFRQMVGKMAKSKMGNIQKATILKDMFGLEDVPQAMAMMTAMAEKGGAAFDEVSHKIHNTNGALNRMNEIMQQGLTPAWQRLHAKGEVLADMLIAKMAPGMVDVLDAVSALIDGAIALVEWFDEITDHGKSLHGVTMALKTALLAVAPAAVVLSLKAVATVLETSVIPAFRKAAAASLAFIRMNLPIILLGTAIAGIALIMQDLYTWMQGGDAQFADWYESFSGAINQMYEIGQTFVAWLLEVAPGLAAFFADPIGESMALLGDFVIWLSGLPELIVEAWSVVSSVYGFFAEGLSASMEVVQPFIDWCMTEFSAMWDFVSALVSGSGSEAWSAFVALMIASFTSAVDFITTSLSGWLAFLAGSLGVTLPYYLLNIPAMFDDAFKAAYDFVAGWIGKAVETVGDLAASIGGVLDKIPGLQGAADLAAGVGSSGSGGWATPGTDAAARGSSSSSNVVIGDTQIDVHVPPGSPPSETGQAVASSHGRMLDRHAANAARIQPRQLR